MHGDANHTENAIFHIIFSRQLGQLGQRKQLLSSVRQRFHMTHVGKTHLEEHAPKVVYISSNQ